MAFAGFTKRKHSTINNGDWDRDGVRNRKDCEPLNFRKQGPEHKEYKVPKKYKGVIKGYRKITRNVDHEGTTLTYSVHHDGGYETEHNTLEQAKIMASKMEGDE